MGIIEEYQQQYNWRCWDRAFRALPDVRGVKILDLGCGVGDLAAEFARRGAEVTGVDGHAELIRFAQGRQLFACDFHVANLHEPLQLAERYDGIWLSFTAAYFPELVPRLRDWSTHLRPNAWICVVEVDDLFGHQPLSESAQLRLETYVSSSLNAKRYDFRMGRKIPQMLQDAGFRIELVNEWDDAEFSFSGPAAPAVLTAWRLRWERMKLLRDHCGHEFESTREEFLAALKSPLHRSSAKVVFALARLPCA